MALGGREVDRDADARDLVVGHLLRDLLGDERRVGADDRHRALLVRVVDDLPDVGPHERLAAGEDDDRVRDRDDVVDRRLDLVERQLAVVVAELGGRAAVDAAQVARARDLPRDDARRLDAGASPGMRSPQDRRRAGSRRCARRRGAGDRRQVHRDAGRVAAGWRCHRGGRRVLGMPAGWPAHRDADSGLTAAGLGVGHLLLVDRACVLAELLFELEVRTGRRISHVLAHMHSSVFRAPGRRGCRQPEDYRLFPVTGECQQRVSCLRARFAPTDEHPRVVLLEPR